MTPERTELDSAAPKVTQSDLLHALLASYSRSVLDPSNELVHLYEIRDALSKHFGNYQNACAALNISQAEWQRLGRLANIEPIKQGRHRGQYVAGRRDATRDELDKVRSLVRKWIFTFARTVQRICWRGNPGIGDRHGHQIKRPRRWIALTPVHALKSAGPNFDRSSGKRWCATPGNRPGTVCCPFVLGKRTNKPAFHIAETGTFADGNFPLVGRHCLEKS
jgi:hypothetical protein